MIERYTFDMNNGMFNVVKTERHWGNQSTEWTNFYYNDPYQALVIASISVMGSGIIVWITNHKGCLKQFKLP